MRALPIYGFRNPPRVANNIVKYHKMGDNCRASGFHPLRLAASLHNRDMVRKVHTPNIQAAHYLRRPANIIRGRVTFYPRMTAPISATGNIDRIISIINYVGGPRYSDIGHVKQRRDQHRRLGNTYFAQNFYTEAARASFREEAMVGEVHATLLGRRANELSSTITKQIQIWEALIIDIFHSPSVERYIWLIFWKSARNKASSGVSESAAQ